mgnify:CR=1 FL=1
MPTFQTLRLYLRLSRPALVLSAALFYALVYVLMSVGGFGMIMLLSREGFDCSWCSWGQSP